MIIRILGEGQFRFDDSNLGDLNKMLSFTDALRRFELSLAVKVYLK